MTNPNSAPPIADKDPLIRFYGSLQSAQNAVDLRAGWTPDHIQAFSQANEGDQNQIADTIVRRLGYLGLDTEDAFDDRMTGLAAGVAALQESKQNAHPVTAVMSAYDRILKGLNPATTSQLELVPAQGLGTHDIAIDESVIDFTWPEQYTKERFMGDTRIAERTVSDITSPYWGFSVMTDTRNGRFFHEEHGPSIRISVPTGQLALSGVAHAVAKVSDRSALAVLSGDYMPDKVTVQTVPASGYGSEAHKNRIQLDTPNLVVASFLKDVVGSNR